MNENNLEMRRLLFNTSSATDGTANQHFKNNVFFGKLLALVKWIKVVNLNLE